MKFGIINFVFAFLILFSSAQAEPVNYEQDDAHTIVQFTWNHNRLSNMSGRFLEHEGVFELDFEKPSKSRVEFTINANSIWTGVDKLDEDMKSERLFDAANFPEIKFVSTNARKTGLERGQLAGELTIKGVTKPVMVYIDVNYNGPHIFPNVEKYKDAKLAGLTIKARVNRSDFGLGMAVPWIADEVDILTNTELVAYPDGKS